MKQLIIAGTRTITDPKVVATAIEIAGMVPSEIEFVISGCKPLQPGKPCVGVDELGAQWAIDHGIMPFYVPAEWEKLGRRAGPFRNHRMANIGSHLVAIWDGASKGTKNMIEEMRKQKKEVYIHIPFSRP